MMVMHRKNLHSLQQVGKLRSYCLEKEVILHGVYLQVLNIHSFLWKKFAILKTTFI